MSQGDEEEYELRQRQRAERGERYADCGPGWILCQQCGGYGYRDPQQHCPTCYGSKVRQPSEEWPTSLADAVELLRERRREWAL